MNANRIGYECKVIRNRVPKPFVIVSESTICFGLLEAFHFVLSFLFHFSCSFREKENIRLTPYTIFMYRVKIKVFRLKISVFRSLFIRHCVQHFYVVLCCDVVYYYFHSANAIFFLLPFPIGPLFIS